MFNTPLKLPFHVIDITISFTLYETYQILHFYVFHHHNSYIISRGAKGPGRDYLPRRRRPGTGDIATPPVRPSVRLSVRLSVCLSVTFSFRTVTQKRIDVFSRNFAGTCTMSWGCDFFKY